jgi:hypothetical protein
MQTPPALPNHSSSLLPKPVMPQLFENSNSEKRFVCGHCHAAFNLHEDMILHLTAGNPDAQYQKISECVTYTCLICNIAFNTFKGMKQHFGKIHIKTKTYPCGICNKLFRDKYAAKFHMQNVHDSSKRVTCNLCEKLCFNKYSFRIHFEKCLKKMRKFT